MSRIAATRSVPIVRQDLIIDVSQVREPAQWPDWIIDVSQVREPAQWPECCIYRVPKKLRNVNKDAYTPKLISIGPLHHGSEELKDMEKLKVRYFKLYCDRVLKGEEGGASTADQEKEVQLQKRLASIVAENSEQIRHCYAECPPLGDEEFVRMILVDATFIIELFLRAFGDEKELRNDYILSKPWLRHDIGQDLILLENQLPFFILEKIHEKFSKPVLWEKTDFLMLARFYLISRSSYDLKEPDLTEVKHLTDLLRYLIYPGKAALEGEGSVDHPNSTSKKPDEAGRNADQITPYNLPSASDLDGAGVVFKMVERGLLEIKFEKSNCLEWIPCLNGSWLLACLPCLETFLKSMEPRLEVPCFLVDDTTETVFRNLMALEQCHYPPRQAYICNYVVLLDSLINTEKDVDLLVSKKIIDNLLGSNDAVKTMINKLCKEIADDNSIYGPQYKKLRKHYDNPWNKAMATLKSVYFANIWRGTATVVGLIVLGFTLWGYIRTYT